MTSTSELEKEEEEEAQNSKNERQVISLTKRKRIHRTQHNNPETKTETHGRYGLLTIETNGDSIDGNPSSTKIQKPPIFVHGVINYGDMIKQTRNTAQDEQYCTKKSGKQCY